MVFTGRMHGTGLAVATQDQLIITGPDMPALTPQLHPGDSVSVNGLKLDITSAVSHMLVLDLSPAVRRGTAFAAWRGDGRAPQELVHLELEPRSFSGAIYYGRVDAVVQVRFVPDHTDGMVDVSYGIGSDLKHLRDMPFTLDGIEFGGRRTQESNESNESTVHTRVTNFMLRCTRFAQGCLRACEFTVHVEFSRALPALPKRLQGERAVVNPTSIIRTESEGILEALREAAVAATMNRGTHIPVGAVLVDVNSGLVLATARSGPTAEEPCELGLMQLLNDPDAWMYFNTQGPRILYMSFRPSLPHWLPVDWTVIYYDTVDDAADDAAVAQASPKQRQADLYPAEAAQVHYFHRRHLYHRCTGRPFVTWVRALDMRGHFLEDLPLYGAQSPEAHAAMYALIGTAQCVVNYEGIVPHFSVPNGHALRPTHPLALTRGGAVLIEPAPVDDDADELVISEEMDSALLFSNNKKDDDKSETSTETDPNGEGAKVEIEGEGVEVEGVKEGEEVKEEGEEEVVKEKKKTPEPLPAPPTALEPAALQEWLAALAPHVVHLLLLGDTPLALALSKADAIHERVIMTYAPNMVDASVYDGGRHVHMTLATPAHNDE